jgi:chromosomal replication initiation ATPase DnaA
MTRIAYLTEADLEQAATIIPNVRINKIVSEVADACGLTSRAIMSDRRYARVSRARQMVYYVAYRHGFSSNEIAEAMGKDHTTILYGIKQEKARRGE